jgi:hypothetical protein
VEVDDALVDVLAKSVQFTGGMYYGALGGYVLG